MGFDLFGEEGLRGGGWFKAAAVWAAFIIVLHLAPGGADPW